MKNCILFLTILSALTGSFSSLTAGEDFVTVYRENRDFLVRSPYSRKYDLVVSMTNTCNESAYLLARDLPLSRCRKEGLILHRGGDEYPANSPLGHYGTLSGNHGSIFTTLLNIPDHSFTEKDIGKSLFTKDGKKEFVIVAIENKDTILIHCPGKPGKKLPGFNRPWNSPLYYNGKPVISKKRAITQLYPMNRITKWELLADGKTPVPEKKEIRCSFVDFYLTHDVLDPREVVDSVKKNPGKTPSPRWTNKGHMFLLHTEELQKKYPVYAGIGRLATFENHYRFDCFGAAVNYRRTTYHKPLSPVRALEVMMNQGGLLSSGKNQIFYIPKLKKFSVIDKKTKEISRTYDFAAKEDMRLPVKASYRISRKDCQDPNNLPDRYIRVSGNDTPLYGAAIGYSLFMGCTAKGKDSTRNEIYFIWKTKKLYPFAYDLKDIPAGKVMETAAYKQFFNPRKEKDATSFYYHFQGESLVVYADFHKELKNKVLHLPKAAAGRKITILEKTPGITLHTRGTIPEKAAFAVSATSGNNYIVLKLDK